jgi:hypothetical protein
MKSAFGFLDYIIGLLLVVAILGAGLLPDLVANLSASTTYGGGTFGGVLSVIMPILFGVGILYGMYNLITKFIGKNSGKHGGAL